MRLMPCFPLLSFKHLLYLSITFFTLLLLIPIFLSSPFFAAFNVRFMLLSLFSPDPCVPLQISKHTQWDGEPGLSWWRSGRQVGQNHALNTKVQCQKSFLVHESCSFFFGNFENKRSHLKYLSISLVWVEKKNSDFFFCFWYLIVFWIYLKNLSHCYVRKK